jgi:hypothetical protein
MARARNIKPGLFKNEILGVADPLYTLLFEGLWLLADRDGKLEDRPLRVKAEVFPYRDANVEDGLNWLHANGFIRRYVVAGKPYILILEFKKHQNPHKNETASEFPDPTTEEIGTSTEKIGSEPDKPGSARADSLSTDSLIPDSLNSVPKGTGMPAGQDPSAPAPDPIFGDGLAYLVRTGVPEKGARSFLGKMRKALNDDLTAVELLVKAQQLEVSDPVPWLRAAAQKRMTTGRTGNTGVAL